MGAYGRLFDIASAVFAPLDAAFALQTSPPAVRFISDGAVAFDVGDGECQETLAVELVRVRPGIPSASGAASGTGQGFPADHIDEAMSMSAEFNVWVLRCAPPMDEEGNPPSIAAIQASAQIVMADAWLLLETVIETVMAGTLVSLCTSVAWLELAGVGPEGGLVGSVFRFSVGL